MTTRSTQGGNAQPIWCSGPGAAELPQAAELGTAAALYFEDNEVYLGPGSAAKGGDDPWIVPNNGARVVIRHNNIVNSQIEIYGIGVQKGFYGCQQAEIYDNTFSAVGLKQGEPQGFISASTPGWASCSTTRSPARPTTARSSHSATKDRSTTGAALGSCDGKNPVDGNQIPAGQKGAGYPCMGQPGRATDVDGDGVFEPSPCYAWNNTLNGAKLQHGAAPLGSESRQSYRQSTSRRGGISSTRSRRRDTTSRTSIRIRCKRAGRR